MSVRLSYGAGWNLPPERRGVTPRKPNLSRQPTNLPLRTLAMPPVTKMRVGASENSRSHHPKTAPQAARSSKRCIMRARSGLKQPEMFAWCRSNRERAVLSYKEAIELAKQSHRERSIRLPHKRASVWSPCLKQSSSCQRKISDRRIIMASLRLTPNQINVCIVPRRNML